MVSLQPSLSLLSSTLGVLFTLLMLVVSFNIDGRKVAWAATAIDNADDSVEDLFAWAKQHGAKIAESIEIRMTDYGGRGIYAKRDIPANTELILIPIHLQLGIRQLAEGTDEEMQKIVRDIPWAYVKEDDLDENDLSFIIPSMALIAEKRKGANGSIFWPFLESLSDDVIDNGEYDLDDLLHWAPQLAKKVQRRRIGIQHLHKILLNPLVSIDDFRWAVSTICARSLARKSTPGMTRNQLKNIGSFAALSNSRMLPIIDMVNHGSQPWANVWVGHISYSDDDIDDFSTSLKSIKDIKAGEELLYDYGHEGELRSNEELLLDYGFILPGHTDRVSISIEEFKAAVTTLNRYRTDIMNGSVPDQYIERLDGLFYFFLKEASKSKDGAWLFFDTRTGEPSLQTLAMAIVMTCRDLDDVSRVLKSVDQLSLTEQRDSSSVQSQIVKGCTEMQKEFARFALKTAAGLALDKRPAVSEKDCAVQAGDNVNSFANLSREYSAMCQEMLKEVADMKR